MNFLSEFIKVVDVIKVTAMSWLIYEYTRPYYYFPFL
jgi:hypothetical protein